MGQASGAWPGARLVCALLLASAPIWLVACQAGDASSPPDEAAGPDAGWVGAWSAVAVSRDALARWEGAYLRLFADGSFLLRRPGPGADGMVTGQFERSNGRGLLKAPSLGRWSLQRNGRTLIATLGQQRRITFSAVRAGGPNIEK